MCACKITQITMMRGQYYFNWNLRSFSVCSCSCEDSRAPPLNLYWDISIAEDLHCLKAVDRNFAQTGGAKFHFIGTLSFYIDQSFFRSATRWTRCKWYFWCLAWRGRSNGCDLSFSIITAFVLYSAALWQPSMASWMVEIRSAIIFSGVSLTNFNQALSSSLVWSVIAINLFVFSSISVRLLELVKNVWNLVKFEWKDLFVDLVVFLLLQSGTQNPFWSWFDHAL